MAVGASCGLSLGVPGLLPVRSSTSQKLALPRLPCDPGKAFLSLGTVQRGALTRGTADEVSLVGSVGEGSFSTLPYLRRLFRLLGANRFVELIAGH